MRIHPQFFDSIKPFVLSRIEAWEHENPPSAMRAVEPPKMPEADITKTNNGIIAIDYTGNSNVRIHMSSNKGGGLSLHFDHNRLIALIEMLTQYEDYISAFEEWQENDEEKWQAYLKARQDMIAAAKDEWTDYHRQNAQNGANHGE